MLVMVFSGGNSLASQVYKSLIYSDNLDNSMTITENEYSLDRQNKGYRNFNEDSTAGLYYLHARYYDSATRQFLTKDPAEMKNLYGYCVSNPVNEWDPTGKIEWGEIWNNFLNLFCCKENKGSNIEENSDIHNSEIDTLQINDNYRDNNSSNNTIYYDFPNYDSEFRISKGRKITVLFHNVNSSNRKLTYKLLTKMTENPDYIYETPNQYQNQIHPSANGDFCRVNPYLNDILFENIKVEYCYLDYWEPWLNEYIYNDIYMKLSMEFPYMEKEDLQWDNFIKNLNLDRNVLYDGLKQISNKKYSLKTFLMFNGHTGNKYFKGLTQISPKSVKKKYESLNFLFRFLLRDCKIIN